MARCRWLWPGRDVAPRPAAVFGRHSSSCASVACDKSASSTQTQARVRTSRSGQCPAAAGEAGAPLHETRCGSFGRNEPGPDARSKFLDIIPLYSADLNGPCGGGDSCFRSLADALRTMNARRRKEKRLFELLDNYGSRHNCFLTALFLNEDQTEYFACFRPKSAGRDESERFACAYLQIDLEEAAMICSQNGITAAIAGDLDQKLRQISRPA